MTLTGLIPLIVLACFAGVGALAALVSAWHDGYGSRRLLQRRRPSGHH
jgi:hypothetical protein